MVAKVHRLFPIILTILMVLAQADSLIINQVMAAPMETGTYEETFSTNASKHFVQGANWNTWENRLRLDRLDGTEKWRPAVSIGDDGYATVVWLVDSGSEADIYAQRIDPQGNRIWETDVIVNSGHTAGDWLTWADVAVDSQGNSIVAWVDRRDGSTYIYAQKISPTGTRLWATDVRVSTSVVAEEEPSIAIDPADQAIIVWKSLYGSIYGQKLSSAGVRLWGGEMRLNASTSQWLEHPIVASWPDTTIAVIWQEDNSIHNIVAQRLDTNGNRLWASDMRINAADIGQTSNYLWPSVNLAVDPNGEMVVAWTDFRSGTATYTQRLNMNGERRWASDVQVDTMSATVENGMPGVSVATDGRAYITWPTPAAGLHMQSIDRNGTRLWTQELRVATDETPYDSVQDMDGSGDIVIVWSGNWGHLFAQRISAAGSQPWTLPVRVNYDSGAAGQYDLDLAPDNNGNFIAVWGDYRNNDKQIYMQRVDSNASRGWEADIRVSAGDMSGGSPTVAVDSLGNAAVVWYDWQGAKPKIYAQRLDAQGNRLWPIDVQVSSENEAASQYDPVVALDASGNLVIAWVDTRSGNRDIYVQKIDTAGNRLWGGDVRVNSDAGTSSQYSPAIAVNDSNNIFVAWQDGRSSSYYDIFAQKLTAAGVKSWVNDVRVNSDLGTSSHQYPDITADSIGNAFIVWKDSRNDYGDIYGQKLDTSGSKLWSNDIRINSDTGSVSQTEATVTSDSSNNVYVCWLDERGGYWDVYAQKLNASGTKLLAGDVQLNSSSGTVGQLSPVDDPVIAADATGKIFAAWVDRRSGNLDVYAQRINSVGSRVWPADLQVVDPDVFYLPTGLAQSRTVDTVNGDIRQATLTANYQTNGGSVEFALSNNGGTNWVTATLGTATVFTTTGSDLRWRAVLTGDPLWRNRSPIVTSLRIEYSTAVPYADNYEADDDCSQAKPIATGGAAQVHTFHQQADADWTWFNVVSGTTYILQTTNVGPQAQTRLELHPTCAAPPTGASISLGNGVTLNFTANQTGPVFVKVVNQSPSVFGANTTYQLSARVVQPNALAVIIAGHDNTFSAQANITWAADRAYNLFRRAGLGKANIRFLDPNPNRDLDGNGVNDDIAGLPTLDNVRTAIQDWPRERGLALGVPLYIYLVDHGLIDHFKANGDALADQVTATDLNLWLSNLEATTGADNINIIIDACYSGSFIDVTPTGLASISGHNRAVIASTTSNWNAYGPGNGEGLYFSNAFFTALENQQSLLASFEAGQQAAVALVAEQQAWLDDNGDHTFTTADGALAASRALRRVTLSGQPPRITSLNLTSSDTIQAQVIDDSAWVGVTVEVFAPDYIPPAPDGSGTTRIINVPVATLTDPDADGLFTATYPFTQTGWYRLVAHAEDTEGNLALPVATRVCVNCSTTYLPLVKKGN